MSYTFEGYLVRGPVPFHGDVRRVVLGQGLTLVPLVDETRQWAEVRFGSDDRRGVLGFERLSAAAHQLGVELSEGGSCVYAQAEFWGGRGFQAAVGWESGSQAFAPVFTCTHADEGPAHWYDVVRSSDGAINRGLRFLGVEADADRDEFDAAGLGRHRNTVAWIDP